VTIPNLAVRVDGLRYAFGDTVAVDNLRLEVPAGGVFGLLGTNGAGKTTALRVMTTLLPVRAGVVRVFDIDVARHRMAVRRLIGYVPQQVSADAALTGRENVLLFARLFDVPRHARAERVAAALDAVGLLDVAHRRAQTYSGGMVRRLELAQALISAPQLLVLDEPTIGLDPIARDSVWQRLHQVATATGMTVLVTTHYMDEAEQHCDRIALMHHGSIHAEGTPPELKKRFGVATLDEVFRAATTERPGPRIEGGACDVHETGRPAREVS
jgi:ABC-2 type transport system ATP-binding protein